MPDRPGIHHQAVGHVSQPTPRPEYGPLRGGSITGTAGPDFLIVGAPKCGTTALNEYLKAHPAIFMAPKEQHYFGSDLIFGWERSDSAKYFASFAPGEAAARRGEASVWYLFSQCAASEIQAYNPNTRIIVMLRNPVDMLYSLHSQLFYSGNEDIASFEEALGAEADRRQGQRIPPTSTFPWALQYRQVARYREQLDRYLALFGPENVHVVFFEDFEADAADAYKRVTEFLKVDAAFNPPFEVVNANKRVRSRVLRDVVAAPPAPLRRIGRAVLPSPRLRDEIRRGVARVNTSFVERQPMDASLRGNLTEEFTPEIQALAELLGTDLDHWCADAGGVNLSARTKDSTI